MVQTFFEYTVRVIKTKTTLNAYNSCSVKDIYIFFFVLNKATNKNFIGIQIL